MHAFGHFIFNILQNSTLNPGSRHQGGPFTTAPASGLQEADADAELDAGLRMVRLTENQRETIVHLQPGHVP